MMDINLKITEELDVAKWQVDAAVNLIDEGNTIPFISRYRKEATGQLNDEQLRKLDERLTYLRNLQEKKDQVLKSIEEQGMLTDELREQIENAETQVAVEQLGAGQHPAVTPLGQQVLVDGGEFLGVAVPARLHVVVDEGHDQLLGLRRGDHRLNSGGGKFLLV